MLRYDFDQGVAVLHMSDTEPVQKFVSCISDAHLAIRNRELEVDVKTLGNGFCQKCQNQLKEPHVCFYDADHVLKTEEVLYYVDEVKKITRPGCPPEVLDVALTSMSSLVKILYQMSSKPYPPSSL